MVLYFFPADYDVEDDENDDSDVFFIKTKQNISAKETIKFQKHAINSVTSRTKHLHEKAFKHYSVQCCKKKCLWKIPFQECLENHSFLSAKSLQES